ncbi:MAG: hypothetical protein ACREBD_07375 [Blastocatellia bacterium]
MAKVTIKFHETTRAQRRKMLRDACRKIDSNESLESLIEKMRKLEDRYGMSTIEFYVRFAAGKMGDSRDFIRWAGAFQAYQDLVRERFDSEAKSKAA